MKYKFIIALIFSPLVFLAQDVSFYHHTSNGEPLLDNFDSFLHSEYGGLTFIFKGKDETFEKVKYYLNGETEFKQGWLQLRSKGVWVKKQLFGRELTKIKTKELSHYTTQVDSFFVKQKVVLKSGELKKPVILKYLGASDKAYYAMYYELKNGVLINKRILRQLKENELWKELGLDQEPKKYTFSFFSRAIEPFKNDSKFELSTDDFLNLLKVEEYYAHFKNNTIIYYDKLWREIRDVKKAVYFGRVTNVEDKIFTVSISNHRERILYKLSYSSLYPLKRHGSFISYNEDGEIRNQRQYDSGDLISSKLFKKNEVIFSFNYINFHKADKSNELTRRVVSVGNHQIKSFRNSSFDYDYFGQPISYTFNKKKIISTSLKSINDSIYFYSNFSEAINTDKLKSLLGSFIYASSNFKNNIEKEDFEGSILLEIETDYKGKTIGYKILESNNQLLHNLVLAFGESYLKSKGLRFKQIALDTKENRCTFVLPINFEHQQIFRTFSRPSYDSNWHWHWHWQQNEWFMQQQRNILNNIPKF